jgi:hypothetical protein
LFSRPPWLAVYQEKVRLPTGRLLDDFYRVMLPDYACVATFRVTGTTFGINRTFDLTSLNGER